MQDEVFHKSIIDINQKNLFLSSKIVSEIVIDKISKYLNQNKTIFLGTSQKGSSGCYVCNNCGYIPACSRCNRNFYLASSGMLKCPVCGLCEEPKDSCPKCSHRVVRLVGVGIKRLHEEVLRLFPKDQVDLIDGDRINKDSLNRISNAVDAQRKIFVTSVNILKIAKHNPKTGLVVFINSDKSFFFPDFTSGIHKFQEISEVLSSRYETLIQTKYPKNEILVKALNNDYNSIYKEELQLRKETNLPPFTQLIKFSIKEAEKEKAVEKIEIIKKSLKKLNYNFPFFMDPYPGFPEKVRNKYVINLAIGFNKDFDRFSNDFIAIVKECNKMKIAVDVDPIGLL